MNNYMNTDECDRQGWLLGKYPGVQEQKPKFSGMGKPMGKWNGGCFPCFIQKETVGHSEENVIVYH